MNAFELPTIHICARDRLTRVTLTCNKKIGLYCDQHRGPLNLTNLQETDRKLQKRKKKTLHEELFFYHLFSVFVFFLCIVFVSLLFFSLHNGFACVFTT